MLTAWKKVRELLEQKAIHRKGFAIDRISNDDAIKHMQDELEELRQEPEDMTEVLDIMAICIHLLVKEGWSCEYAERVLIEKLDARFTIPPGIDLPE